MAKESVFELPILCKNQANPGAGAFRPKLRFAVKWAQKVKAVCQFIEGLKCSLFSLIKDLRHGEKNRQIAQAAEETNDSSKT